MIRFLLILAFVSTGIACRAQFMDTLYAVLRARKYSLDARLESRNSFISNQLISVAGVRLGLDFQRRLRIGGGVSWLKSDFKDVRYVPGPLGKTDTLSSRLKFVYFCYYIDFVFYKTKHWQLSVPIQAGTGSSWFQNSKDYSLGNHQKKYFLLLYEPGITVQFKVTRWAGLGADVAYRFTLKNNKQVADQLNSPTYSFKVLFWFDYLFYELFPKSKITERFGPAYW